jgi:high-affinity nickel-transport protein
MIDVITVWLLGVVLGMRHALEPDHLAAVSTLISDERSRFRGVLLGASWGLGHTLSLFAVGCALAVLQVELPQRVGDGFELGVALMLIFLGVRAIRRSFQRGADGAVVAHRHGATTHSHAASVGHVHLGRWAMATRPLIIGLVHGLAGSGALTALVVAELPTTGARLLYIALFGLGSVLGMAVLSGLLTWPLSALGRSSRVFRALSALTGALSFVLGILWGYPLVGAVLA